ncbi:hypothetical protein [uncultured Sphaerochaeta sp.]|uniref:hypothetical protein n=1 Tax=uncultured Sphaerochaeta sp. TaxID=886478 RepID=UPI002611650E|nr:hypothetical protein [uncultured Sphaerochaeta sp.]
MNEEEKIIQKLAESQAELDKILANVPAGVNPYNEDGSVNYSVVIGLLKSPRYKEWRESEQVKPYLSELKTDVIIDSVGKAINLGIDFAKLGYAVSQIRKGKKGSEATAPEFPAPPERSDALRTSIAEATRQANMGLTPEEAALAREEDTRNYRTGIARAIATSGGQSGVLGQRLQGLASLRNLQALRRSALASQQRNQGAARLGSLAAQQVAENQAIAQHGVNRFRYRDFPLYTNELQQAQATELAGRQNMWGAIDSLGTKITGMLFQNRSAGGMLYPEAGAPQTPAQAASPDTTTQQQTASVPQTYPQDTAWMLQARRQANNSQGSGYYGMGGRPTYRPIPSPLGPLGPEDYPQSGLGDIMAVDDYLNGIGLPGYPTKLRYR